jgi:hypothetical protein
VKKKIKVKEKIQFSEKGMRMAKIVAEYLLMRYFFPELKERKKQALVK